MSSLSAASRPQVGQSICRHVESFRKWLWMRMWFGFLLIVMARAALLGSLKLHDVPMCVLQWCRCSVYTDTPRQPEYFQTSCGAMAHAHVIRVCASEYQTGFNVHTLRNIFIVLVRAWGPISIAKLHIRMHTLSSTFNHCCNRWPQHRNPNNHTHSTAHPTHRIPSASRSAPITCQV
jgi:hypothetical protein